MDEHAYNLTIHRYSDPFIVRKLKITINGEQYKFEHGESRQFNVPKGKYSIQASLDYFWKSNLIHIQLDEQNSQIELFISYNLHSNFLELFLFGLRFKNSFTIRFSPKQAAEVDKEPSRIANPIFSYIIPALACLVLVLASWLSVLPYKIPIEEQAICLVSPIFFYFRSWTQKKSKNVSYDKYYHLSTSALFLFFALAYPDTKGINLPLSGLLLIVFIVDYYQQKKNGNS